MELTDRKSVHDNLKKYCVLAKENSYIEVTEWVNGEGWDITIDDRSFHLTWGELEAINYLVKVLDYEDKKK